MRKTSIAGLTVICAMAMAGDAFAATAVAAKPTVATSAADQIQPTSARLRGAVNPQGSATSYYFQYGTTKAYGSQTGPLSAGAGKKGIAVKTPVVGLKSATTYHFRIVATNEIGATVGADKTFTTANQPLGFTLTAAPNPVTFGGPTTLSGVLSGTGNAGKNVQLQQRVFPYTTGFANVGNAQQVTTTGAFSFPILSLTQNTQYRVVSLGSGSVTSPIVLVNSAVIVRVAARSTATAGQRVRFAGTVTPKEDGALYALQKQRGDAWVTIGGGSLRPYAAEKSRYAIRARVTTSGTYRIYVGVADGTHASSVSPDVKITVKKATKKKSAKK